MKIARSVAAGILMLATYVLPSKADEGGQLDGTLKTLSADRFGAWVITTSIDPISDEKYYKAIHTDKDVETYVYCNERGESTVRVGFKSGKFLGKIFGERTADFRMDKLNYLSMQVANWADETEASGYDQGKLLQYFARGKHLLARFRYGTGALATGVIYVETDLSGIDKVASALNARCHLGEGKP